MLLPRFAFTIGADQDEPLSPIESENWQQPFPGKNYTGVLAFADMEAQSSAISLIS